MATNNSCNYAPVIHTVQVGGTSGSLSSVTNGTTGQVLTATTSSDPSWQNNPGVFAPNSTIILFDDFISSASNSIIGSLNWTLNGTTASSAVTASNAHPGIIGFGSTAASSSSGIALKNQLASASSTSGTWIVGGGAITMNWVFNIATASNGTNRYILRFGFNDGNPSTGDITNGIYFEYSDNINSGNWNYKTSSASTRTTSTSSVAVTTGWHNAKLVINAAGTSISFSMDGVSLGTAITTNIPSTAITPAFVCEATVGTVAVNSVTIDLFYLTQTLTTAR